MTGELHVANDYVSTGVDHLLGLVTRPTRWASFRLLLTTSRNAIQLEDHTHLWATRRLESRV